MHHHLAIALVALAMSAMASIGFDHADLRTRSSAATAYVALGCVALSLMLGPLNLLLGRANPVSADLRRDLGIWGGVVGLAHAGVGLTVHLRGKMNQYFLPAPEAHSAFPLRMDAFGVANDLGVLSGVVLLALLLVSSDVALRRLGTARWKRWQRWSYAGAIAMLGHGALYQVLEGRRLMLAVLFLSVVLAVLALQALGVQIMRRGDASARGLRR